MNGGSIGTGRAHEPIVTETSEIGCRKIDRAAFHAGAWLISRTIFTTQSAESGACDKQPLADPLQTGKRRFTCKFLQLQGNAALPMMRRFFRSAH
jgi:hypothetical protein